MIKLIISQSFCLRTFNHFLLVRHINFFCLLLPFSLTFFCYRLRLLPFPIFFSLPSSRLRFAVFLGVENWYLPRSGVSPSGRVLSSTVEIEIRSNIYHDYATFFHGHPTSVIFYHAPPTGIIL
ncbi:hypothetical protein GIB67_027324 [Kingdonia uniflora]|uniref:Uncharacterized protein n=1 Tax=Kingdonia uniflora TaxID=39325 RepID=A0A7J7MF28_9MAGN|nr:hypothetical protein GIB67_027324 [Kingdonia uniflora]